MLQSARQTYEGLIAKNRDAGRYNAPLTKVLAATAAATARAGKKDAAREEYERAIALSWQVRAQDKFQRQGPR